MDSHESFPSMYKRNLRKEKYIENIFESGPNAPAHLPWTGNEGTTAIGYTSSERTFYLIQTPTSEQHGRGAACFKAHDRFAAQNTRP
jgi:hypothetical protein